MKLVFDKKGNLVLAQKKLNIFYIDNKDYDIEEVKDFDSEYLYTYNNGVVKGDKIVISDKEMEQIEADLIATKHEQPRKKEYPAIEEQLDKLFHDIENGTLDKNGGFYKSLKQVKDNFPKK